MKLMIDEKSFEDIRPYRDDEIPAAMQRIAGNTSFPLLASYVFPDEDIARVRELVESIRTVDEFQAKVMSCMNARVIANTVDEFTYGGLELLSADKRYLFVSNHRDIVLDSSLMQYVLYCNGHETSEITFGANLMQGQLVIDIGKSNKMFKVERPGANIKEFYKASRHLSDYIRHAVCDKRHSVWIAQRNGRTKDGIDLTDQGLVKMLGMSMGGDKVASIAALNIAPVAISYEWEPCDVLKALELYEKRKMGSYVKKPGEDINSILTGIVQPKGRVHLEFCPPLRQEELSAFGTLSSGDFNRAVSNLIDQRIHRAYRLTPNNYIAHDLKSGSEEYACRYTEGQKSAFMQRFDRLRQYEDDCDVELLSDIWLGIYAHPVDTVAR